MHSQVQEHNWRPSHHHSHYHHGHRPHGYGNGRYDMGIFANYGRMMPPQYGRPYGPQQFFGRPFGMLAAGVGIGAFAYNAGKNGSNSFFGKIGSFLGRLFGKAPVAAEAQQETGDTQTTSTGMTPNPKTEMPDESQYA